MFMNGPFGDGGIDLMHLGMPFFMNFYLLSQGGAIY
jgi:hypothetical protein